MTKRAVWIWLKKLRWLLIILLLIAPVLYFVHLELDLCSLIRSLPSDEKMIANFKEHREDFEKLVRIYQYDPSARFDAFSLVPTPQVEAIMKRANVDLLFSDLENWVPPDPYADEARERSLSSKKIGKNITSLCFDYAHDPVRMGINKFDHVRKGYYYTPIAPRIEKGRQYPAYELLCTPNHKMRLFKSLDNYPESFLPGECYFRQIESQWFIKLCRGE